MKLKTKLCLFWLLIAPILLGCNGFGNWDGGIFPDPFTGGWVICLLGKCLP